MKAVTGRMVLPGVYNFYTMGAIVTPAATAYEPTVGLAFGLITGLGAVVSYFTSYTLSIRIPTEEERKEWLDDERS